MLWTEISCDLSNTLPHQASSNRIVDDCHLHSPLPQTISSHPTMATRRIISNEKTILDKDDTVGASPAASEKSNITPAVPA